MRGGQGVASRPLSVLSAVFSFGMRLGLVPTNPTKNVKAPKGAAPGRYLSDEEWARLGAAMTDARAKAQSAGFIDAINLIALTGCRKSEICNLTWSEVDFGQGFLRLSKSKVGPRAVPLGDRGDCAFGELEGAADSEWVFPSRRGDGADCRPPKGVELLARPSRASGSAHSRPTPQFRIGSDQFWRIALFTRLSASPLNAAL